MLATLTHETFSLAGWIFERKLDGERCLAFCTRDAVRLFSRNQKPLDAKYPEIADAVRRQATRDLIVDGEIVAFSGESTSFARLQQRMQVEHPPATLRASVPVFYYVFDLVFDSGRDLRARPLIERKRLLRDALVFKDPIRFTEHRETDGEAFYRDACRAGWEGLIAKDGSSCYTPGRSRDWLKFKCAAEQEFVIGGWTDPQGSRVGFGALLVGYYEKGKLCYAGKVGTGYNDALLRSLARRLARLETSTSPFIGARSRPGVHWVKPELIAQIGFTEWTSDGKLRHPRFLGLRDDKSAREVVREA